MTTEKEFYCTDAAWDYGISLVGTATRGDIWFLLEHAGPWGAKAFEESNIPGDVKSHIMATNHPQKRVRVLLIRQTESHRREGVRFFVGQTSPLEPRLYEYYLDDYTDLEKLDLSSFVAGEPGDPTHLRQEPLYLVCTNGRRDRCCSIYGPEVYQAMTEQAGDAVWQSAHIGGHNQAPITLFLPHGINYGHTTPSEARRLVRAYQREQIVLHHYRGRVCYENHIQAAEHFWREQTGVLDLPGMRVEVETELDQNQWMVTISGLDDQHTEQIHVQRRQSEHSIPITCSKKKESKIISFHRLG
jgi:hypothetical protein